MTTKLYYDNPYIEEAVSSIVEVIEDGNKTLVVLDKTPFYPEGGGQLSDTGYIDDIRVTYVFEKEDVVYHQVEKRPEGKEVTCKVDMDVRIDHTVQHTGEHLLASAFYKLFDINHSGFHMGEEYSTIDINLNEISEEIIKKVEQEVNQYVFDNVEIKTYSLLKEEAEKLPTRKGIKVDGEVRIVQIGAIDYSACCGTHVLRSGEIGLVKIIKTEKYKGLTRVYFICGKRALNDYINKHYIVRELAKRLSSEESAIVEKVEAQSSLIKEQSKKITEYKKAFSAFDAEELIKNAMDTVVVKIYEDKNFEDIGHLADQLEGIPHIFILGSGVDKRLLVFHDGSFELSCGKIFKATLSSFNGKGGGSDKKAQATFENVEMMNSFIEEFKAKCNF